MAKREALFMNKNNKISAFIQVVADVNRRVPGAKRNAWRALICVLGCLSGVGQSWGQAVAPEVLGEWRMDERVRRTPGIVYNERDLRIFVIDQNADGTYRVISTVTIHMVAEREDVLLRPECRGKKECTFDDASEGVGRLDGDKFYVDWIAEPWIDDVFTIAGNRMTGHDGNAPLDFTRVE